ncbi:glycosyltransferase family 4 [Fusarium subglutinans]|uniref:Glycosyltransferase family 4 n=1 Tax=Gibberella subglutinans TaxID=42677 RepID=A0A8H5P5E4_GIBSU|nr:glycosyltransferase family 4 [Fusarium subglutinans]KAF5587110.1 glycosyltransferase family 4 [Fusarium subglutinans]
MRVFLIQTAKGLFSSSGGYKANNALLRYLSSRGHCVRQLCYSYRGEVENYMNSGDEVDSRLRTRYLHMRSESDKPGNDVQVHELSMEDGVEALALDSEAFDAAFGGKLESSNQLARMSAEYIENGTSPGPLMDFISFLQEEIKRFSPTHIISNDGLSMKASLAPELAHLTMSRIAVVHTAEQLPFGPFAGGLPGHSSTTREADLFQKLDGIWSVSDTIRKYALEHGQLETRFLVLHPWTYLVGKDHAIPDRVFNWDKKFVGMINPCPVKGARILVDLARKCPQLEFLTYMSWGADDATVKDMEALSNMTVRPSCATAKDLWRDIKVLVVPSLWCEAWGMVVVEAHLRGIPVVSSNAGALSESMLGLDYIIPVTPITGQRDESGRYLIPEQDVAPWVKVITKLMQDRSEYEKVSTHVRNTTMKWLKSNSEADIETWLMGMRTESKI